MLLTVLGAGLSGAGGSLAAEIVLAGKKVAPYPILTATNAAALEKTAAQELAVYLKRMSGADFAVGVVTGTVPERAICVGRLGAELPADLGLDGFVIQTKGHQLHIAGGTQQGTIYAVYAFLEEVLGCRWWTFNEEDVPAMETPAIGELAIVKKPPFSMHDLFNREAQNSTSNFVYKSRCLSSEQFTGGHTLCPMMAEYGKTHPEIYPADKTGQRKPNDLHLCYTATNLSEALAETFEKDIKARNGNVTNFIYFAGMGDWYGGMCECSACTNIYAEETWIDPDGRTNVAYTATLLRMINKTAEILEAKYPGIRVGTFAYMSLEAPPAKTTPRTNVVIWLPHLRHDIVHPVPAVPANRNFRLNLERWAVLAPNNVYIWDYGANFDNFMYPFPCIRSIAENIKYYKSVGVRGIMVQGNYVSTGSDMVALKNYIWRKLLWNPSLDFDALLEEFCRGYYGPAWKAMNRYVRLLEDAVAAQKDVPLNEFAKLSDIKKVYLNEELVRNLRQALNEALQKTKGEDTFYRRVKEAEVGLDVVELWSVGPLEEKDGVLIRKDLGAYTWPRAVDLVKYCRNGSPREWGTGEVYRRGFLTTHGGPLVSMTNGPLVVKVAPVLSGRIRQILYEGQPLLHTGLPSDAGYPQAGGVFETLSPAPFYFTVTNSGPGNRLDMTAELGIGHWNGAVQKAGKSVELGANGAIQIRGMVGTLTGQAQANNVVAGAVYAVGTNLSDFTLEVLVKEGEWQQVPFTVEKPAAELPKTSCIKLSLPAKACVVTDELRPPEAVNGKAVYNITNGTLSVELTISPIAVPAGGEAAYCRRELIVQPLK
ncbi:MAG: DUF4838 domain-containing protein [Lentisphaerae bacterium]|nr:DUF4838 domain-containing protein [Lentisphaerota bacterium]